MAVGQELRTLYCDHT